MKAKTLIKLFEYSKECDEIELSCYSEVNGNIICPHDLHNEKVNAHNLNCNIKSFKVDDNTLCIVIINGVWK